MIFKISADLIVLMHFFWISFMLAGFVLTLCGFFWKRYFDLWLVRTVHLLGITYVGLLAVLGKYCPLTILENSLRTRHNPELAYTGSFIIHRIEKLVYPDVDPLIILIPTALIAVFAIAMFIIKLPVKIREMI
ncbi:DUF2784 domain-containing protein [bacterium]|nr:DUF2784 domain-containing protein [bacterium]MBU3929071.1 DUF2784 domain-containing protein [bacterium]MBU4123683.1 DUF2784 domain-containing protein [bacterium]